MTKTDLMQVVAYATEGDEAFAWLEFAFNQAMSYEAKQINVSVRKLKAGIKVRWSHDALEYAKPKFSAQQFGYASIFACANSYELSSHTVKYTATPDRVVEDPQPMSKRTVLTFTLREDIAEDVEVYEFMLAERLGLLRNHWLKKKAQEWDTTPVPRIKFRKSNIGQPFDGPLGIIDDLLITLAEHQDVIDPITGYSGLELAELLPYRIEPPVMVSIRAATGRIMEVTRAKVEEETRHPAKLNPLGKMKSPVYAWHEPGPQIPYTTTNIHGREFRHPDDPRVFRAHSALEAQWLGTFLPPDCLIEIGPGPGIVVNSTMLEEFLELRRDFYDDPEEPVDDLADMAELFNGERFDFPEITGAEVAAAYEKALAGENVRVAWMFPGRADLAGVYLHLPPPWFKRHPHDTQPVLLLSRFHSANTTFHPMHAFFADQARAVYAIARMHASHTYPDYLRDWAAKQFEAVLEHMFPVTGLADTVQREADQLTDSALQDLIEHTLAEQDLAGKDLAGQDLAGTGAADDEGVDKQETEGANDE